MVITDEIWEIIKNNDKKLDNRLWYGVVTTKIFCKPSCMSRLPKRENVKLFCSPKLAQSEGYHPCKRCQPMDKILPNEMLVKEVDSILKNCYKEEFSLEELTHRLHSSSSYLRHVYKKTKGVTPRQQLMMIRLEQAKTNLLTSNASISEIAQSVGLMNTSYFIKVFRKHYGSSPNQYRKMIKNKFNKFLKSR
ncbi:Ada metal-binding domain-containing protein [Lactococcus sp.]|uniref:Ada metal-binding domain-containing protein n=1 Tax=Lactococcus sp. TaxID=44273 RepID=UPI002FC982AB